MAKKGYILFGECDGFGNDSYLATNKVFTTIEEANNWARKNLNWSKQKIKVVFSEKSFHKLVDNNPSWTQTDIEEFLAECTPEDWKYGVEVEFFSDSIKVISAKKFKKEGCSNGCCIVELI